MVISPDEIPKLSVPERLALIEVLWDSIGDSLDSPALTDAQRQELVRRRKHDAKQQSEQTVIDDADDQPGRYAMTLFKHRSKEEEEQLIEKFIGLDNELYGGRADARLKSGPSIWAIVSYLDIYKGDLEEIAGHFDISQDEIDAALAFYRRNKKYIDARIIVNEA